MNGSAGAQSRRHQFGGEARKIKTPAGAVEATHCDLNVCYNRSAHMWHGLWDELSEMIWLAITHRRPVGDWRGLGRCARRCLSTSTRLAGCGPPAKDARRETDHDTHGGKHL